ncbi:hypothetical protein L1887_29958 [Cichorium endivia]|nr:hypothetical protein L1887_29958 [Cichorium endivia]
MEVSLPTTVSSAVALLPSDEIIFGNGGVPSGIQMFVRFTEEKGVGQNEKQSNLAGRVFVEGLKLPFFCDIVAFPSLLHYQEPNIKEGNKAQKTF